MTTVHIAPLDDDAKHQLLKAVASQGKASGLEAAAKVILDVVRNSTRVVGTNTLRDVAAALNDAAKRERDGASGVIAHLGNKV